MTTPSWVLGTAGEERKKEKLPKIVAYISLLRCSHALRSDQLEASLGPAEAGAVAKADHQFHLHTSALAVRNLGGVFVEKVFKFMFT